MCEVVEVTLHPVDQTKNKKCKLQGYAAFHVIYGLHRTAQAPHFRLGQEVMWFFRLRMPGWGISQTARHFSTMERPPVHRDITKRASLYNDGFTKTCSGGVRIGVRLSAKIHDFKAPAWAAIRNYLNRLPIPYETEVPIWGPLTVQPFRLDFYLRHLKVAIEADDATHWGRGSRETNVTECIRRDKTKEELCRTLGVRLIRILDKDTPLVQQILDKELPQSGRTSVVYSDPAFYTTYRTTPLPKQGPYDPVMTLIGYLISEQLDGIRFISFEGPFAHEWMSRVQSLVRPHSVPLHILVPSTDTNFLEHQATFAKYIVPGYSELVLRQTGTGRTAVLECDHSCPFVLPDDARLMYLVYGDQLMERIRCDPVLK